MGWLYIDLGLGATPERGAGYLTAWNRALNALPPPSAPEPSARPCLSQAAGAGWALPGGDRGAAAPDRGLLTPPLPPGPGGQRGELPPRHPASEVWLIPTGLSRPGDLLSPAPSIIPSPL